MSSYDFLMAVLAGIVANIVFQLLIWTLL